MDAIYEVHGLTKRYGRTAALNGVDFAVTPGKLVGLLGPNGSGKTTLMKISAGLLQPTAGSVIIDKVPVGVFTKAITSYLPDRMALPTEFTADDAVSLYADFFTDFDKVKANAMLADLHIGGRDKIDSMSKGTQEKMQLCLTMSRAARLYLLDEPLGGVDPAARDYILSTIMHNYSEDAALMLSTHLIGDIEKVLDEVILYRTARSCARPPSTSCARKQGRAWTLTSGRFTNADETFALRVQDDRPRRAAHCGGRACAEHFY